jgi:hypothetical protein
MKARRLPNAPPSPSKSQAHTGLSPLFSRGLGQDSR